MSPDMAANTNAIDPKYTTSEYSSVNDSVLIRSELQELADIESSVIGRKKDIILQAADKLAMKYVENPSIVSTKLKAILSKDITVMENGKAKTTYARISPQYIMDVLPAKYKQANSRRDEKKDDTPTNLFEEALTLMAECLDVASATTKNMLKTVQKIRTDDPKLYNEIKSDFGTLATEAGVAQIKLYLEKELSEIRNIKQFVNLLKNILTTARSLQSLQDPRQKFSAAAKLNLRILFVTDSYDHLAAKLTGNKYGGKWLSMIDRDPRLKSLAELIKCPACLFDGARWIEKAKHCQDEGLEIPAYKDFTNAS